MDNLSGLNGWTMIWESSLPLRIQHFLWLIRRQRLLTNSEWVHRCMTDNACYVRCGGTQELVLHALCDYLFAQKVWLKCLLEIEVNELFSLN